MTRKLVLVLLLTCSLFAVTASAQPFDAADCYVGPGLAATLLFPYFEVDLANPQGVGTLLSINNGLNTGGLVRVVFWTDWGLPTAAFDIYIEGFGVETINVVDVLSGNIPSTGSGVDLSGFEFCDILPPFHSNPAVTGDEQAQLVADHTGQAGPIFADCAGSPQGDQIARGYITVDVVDECSGVEGTDAFFSPVNTSTPYFADGGSTDGIAIATNRLWGDIIYVDFTNNSAQGTEAIPVWANPTLFSDTDIFTFYGRFSAWDGRDERVPLPSIWDQRFLNGGPFAGGADLIVWRDPGSVTGPADCGMQPPEFPLSDDSFAFEFDGTLVGLASGDNYPLTTQRVSVDSLGIPFSFGWLQVQFSPAGQGWIQPSLNSASLFSANFNGTPADFLCDQDPTPTLLTNGGEEPTSAGAPRRAAPSTAGKFAPRTSQRTLRQR